MAFKQEPLPYSRNALEPHMSAATLKHHYGHHHATYVEKLNELSKGTPYAKMSLEEVVLTTADDDGAERIFQNAAQAWNHDFFWKSMTPGGGGRPAGALACAIDDAFGSHKAFSEAFVKHGLERFGSGWVWLVSDDDGLRIVSTPNGRSVQVDGPKPLLVCDVWEHAYYLDHQHRRERFLKTFLTHLANWDFAGRRMNLEGEGTYTASRAFRAGQEAFAASGKVAKAARAAADALDGPEGGELRAAEARAARRR